jgi:hypothetical protein
VVVVLTGFRLARYLRLTLKKPAALPASADADAAHGTASPIGPPGAGGRRRVLVFLALLAAAVALWAVLFSLPVLAQWPVLPRLVAGVLVTLWLLQLARRIGRRTVPAPPQDGNPIR